MKKIRLFYRKKSKGLFSYFLGNGTILLKDDNQSLMDLNYKEEGDSFLCAYKFGSDDETKDEQLIFNLNGEERCFDSHEILNMNYEQFKHKFNIPQTEDVEFTYKYNCFNDKYPSITYKKFDKSMSDIRKGEIKCIVIMNEKEEIEVGLPENSLFKNLKLKLFNYFYYLKRPFLLIPLEEFNYFEENSKIIYSPDKIMKFLVELS